jgi:hypothetical protein
LKNERRLTLSNHSSVHGTAIGTVGALLCRTIILITPGKSGRASSCCSMYTTLKPNNRKERTGLDNNLSTGLRIRLVLDTENTGFRLMLMRRCSSHSASPCRRTRRLIPFSLCRFSRSSKIVRSSRSWSFHTYDRVVGERAVSRRW